MADRLCRECEGAGDCRMCSPSFQPDRVHAACGRRWKDHKPDSRGWARCPKPKVWHHHGRPLISAETPPHVHAHANGDDVTHTHRGLSEVVSIEPRGATNA